MNFNCMNVKHNENVLIVWKQGIIIMNILFGKLNNGLFIWDIFSLIYFPHIIHSLHQLQDVQYDKSKPNIGFDGNAWGFEYREYKIKKKQNKQTTPP